MPKGFPNSYLNKNTDKYTGRVFASGKYYFIIWPHEKYSSIFPNYTIYHLEPSDRNLVQYIVSLGEHSIDEQLASGRPLNGIETAYLKAIVKEKAPELLSLLNFGEMYE